MATDGSGERPPQPPAVTLVMRRRRTALVMLGGVTLTAVCLLPPRGAIDGLVAVFLGASSLAAAVALIRPPRLHLAASGMTLTSQWGRSQFIAWESCSAFTTWSGTPGARSVVVDSRAIEERHRRSSVMARSATGGNGLLQAGYGRLSAGELAVLLNRYRDSYSAR